jgi:16S rRNA (guanine966-N2)-methyltransferase
VNRPSGLRIGSGTLKGRRLESPPAARPTGARLREAVLAIWGERLVGAAVLDLFAGSGAVGLEALSRGAAHATFIESAPSSLAVLRRNLDLVPAERRRLIAATAVAGLGRLGAEGARFDLLFADPPYEIEVDARLAASLSTVARPGACLVVEHRRRGGRPGTGGGWRLSDERSYGDSQIAIYELEPTAGARAD